MPYKSDAQRRFMHAQHPQIAKRWDAEAKHTPKGKDLPDKVGSQSRKPRGMGGGGQFGGYVPSPLHREHREK